MIHNFLYLVVRSYPKTDMSQMNLYEWFPSIVTDWLKSKEI